MRVQRVEYHSSKFSVAVITVVETVNGNNETIAPIHNQFDEGQMCSTI
jgi:hypothetical protein